jgi:two-component system sensor histidine kinase BaeS
VEETVRALAEETGRRITLVGRDRTRPLAASAPGRPLPDRPAAVVDPLRVDPALAKGTGADRVDPRIVGPYRLTAAERRELNGLADGVQTCLEELGWPVLRDETPSGRPVVRLASGHPARAKANYACPAEVLDTPVPSEQAALDQLNALVAQCSRRQHITPPEVGLDFTVPATSKRAQDCVDSARREQLQPYAAPPVALYLGGPTDAGGLAGVALSPAGTTRIAVAAFLVLLVTVSVTALVGARMVRPLRALTEAALRPETGRVRVRGRDEIGHLAIAFNDLSERRERLEAQRKAMVSDVAHELRNPLSNLRLWLEAAQDGVADLDQDLTASLLEEAVQLQHLVDDLQDLAAADAGTLRLHPEHLAVADFLHQSASAHRAAAGTGRVTLTVIAPDDLFLRADPVRLRQVVDNLVSNALRHTPPGGKVTLAAEPQADDVVVQVADTGTGIAARNLPRVFDRFWRADPSRSRRTGGSGLGLAIVRQLAEAHGGTVTVRSTPGKGTVFTLRLPGLPAEGS